MQSAPGVKVLLDCGQQVLFAFCGGLAEVGDPRVRESFMSCHAGGRVDGEAAADELASCEGDAAPVFKRSERVIGDKDSLHFFEVGVAVKRSVAAEEEVGYHANGPDVTVAG